MPLLVRKTIKKIHKLSSQFIVIIQCVVGRQHDNSYVVPLRSLRVFFFVETVLTFTTRFVNGFFFFQLVNNILNGNKLFSIGNRIGESETNRKSSPRKYTTCRKQSKTITIMFRIEQYLYYNPPREHSDNAFRTRSKQFPVIYCESSYKMSSFRRLANVL